MYTLTRQVKNHKSDYKSYQLPVMFRVCGGITPIYWENKKHRETKPMTRLLCDTIIFHKITKIK